MKPALFNEEANNIWKKAAASDPAFKALNLELDLYKKLLSFFQVGDYYYYIFNLQNYDFEFISKEVEAVLGYGTVEMSVPFFMDKIHPEDRPWFLNFENTAVTFLAQLPMEKLMKYKRRYDYRVKKKDGSYIRILHQAMVVEHDENGHVLRSLAVHTDITDLKPEGKPVLSFIGLDGEPSYINVDVEKDFCGKQRIFKQKRTTGAYASNRRQA